MANLLFDALFAPLNGRTSAVLILPCDREIIGDAFHAQICRIANVLHLNGIQPGDRVAAQITKSPEALALYGACVALGVVFLPLNPAYTDSEVAYFLTDATPRLLVCDSARAATLAPEMPVLTLNSDGSGTLIDAAKTQPATFTPTPRQPDDLAALLYTSGTTGRSKGAMLSQDNLLSNAQTLARLWRFTSNDTLLHALPIFHTHGLFVATNVALLTHGTMIFLPNFHPDTILHHLPRATAMMGVPTFYTRLLDDPRFTKQAAAHMRLFISGSAPLLHDTHRAFEARTGQKILERYGMTETNMNTSNPYMGERRAGTVGHPLPGVEVKITENGETLPQGKTGMIEVRGPNVFKGYWNMPDKTAAELRPDGFFLPGDLGLFDADGYLHIVGRQKDLIISGGFNIYPKELELLLDATPGVAESAVIGLPHPDFGEAVFAVLTAVAGTRLDPDQVLKTLHASLARFKHPKAAVVVNELPRNAMGKVQKNVLRAEYGGWFG
ncbi:MAG: malonyl-CoA synthase [Rhodoferax sp.]|nr:malonyl-CoA synthase [Pseudorhodobacter sp.]